MAVPFAAVAAVCLIVGWLAGTAWTRMTRSWRDWRAQKVQVAVLFTLARKLTVNAVVYVGVAAVVAGLTVYTFAAQR